MGLYLIKVTACLAIFFVFYKIMLENESMHIFKRFYLLTALIVAAVIPTILFTEYIYISPEPIVDIAVSEFTIKEMPLPTQKNDLITPSLWVIYGIGVLVFGYKFCNNLFKLSTRIKRNPKIKYDRSIHVLLEERLSPHTFFNFIFLNKQKFEAHEIPEAVLLHEQTHAAQKHSIDVLFIELIQVLLWFNPLVYLFKGAIKLNHEFLADQAVLKKGTQLPNYQQILLAFSSNATETQLANAINYSSIKKRFTIMKKTTSKKAVWLRSLLVLPIFALALYGFSESELIEIDKSLENSVSSNLPLENLQGQKSDSIGYEYIEKPIAPNTQDIAKWKNGFKYALWIDGKHTSNKELENYKLSEFIHYSSSFIYDNARSEQFPQPYQVSLFTKNEFKKQFTTNNRELNIHINKAAQILIQGKLVSVPGLKQYLSKLNTDLSKEEKSKTVRAFVHVRLETSEQTVTHIAKILEEYGCFTIDIVGEKEQQDGATIKQLAAYNTIARKYNEMNSATMRIKKGEIDHMTYLYSIMTEDQKKNAEAFPILPPMPEPPMPPSTQKVAKGEFSAIPTPPVPPAPPKTPNDVLSENERLKKEEEKLDQQEKHLKQQEKALQKQEEKLLKNELALVNETSTPAPPKSPLDHVMEMAKKNANFYYEGKAISSDKAIDLIKNNNKLNIDTRNTGSKNPTVKISKNPIVIKN
ncbi:M56 family metallopeptidase [Cellulophaga sp. Z1A5H]|uniref:M56 family metallopeptidase n=2 Tax=Cellulophaga TaxID=104264 RepID=UPI0013FE11A4|nr:M56 family metallopeptidase [Cellulophaga sp. Z1A5H]